MARLFVTCLGRRLTVFPRLHYHWRLLNLTTSQLRITATVPQNTTHQLFNMTTFDVFCTLTIIDMREAERAEAALIEEAKKETDRIANLSFSPGDAAKGAKLFQVSSLLLHAHTKGT